MPESKSGALDQLGESPSGKYLHMKLEQSIQLIKDQLALVDHTGETKQEQLIWELGFLLGMLADELRNDWILENNLRNRIKRVVDQRKKGK